MSAAESYEDAVGRVKGNFGGELCVSSRNVVKEEESYMSTGTASIRNTA